MIEVSRVATCDSQVNPLTDMSQCIAVECGDEVGVPNQRSDSHLALNILELELVAPGDDGTPQKLIRENNDQQHGEDAVDQGLRIAIRCRRLQVGAKTGEPE